MEENVSQNQQPTPQINPPKEPENSANIDPKSKEIVMTSREFEEAKLSQRLIPAIIVGAIVAVVCALLWAGISLGTGYQIGYMAVAIGIAVGFTIKKVGRGVTSTFGVVGAILALASCLLGNVLMVVGYLVGEGISDFSRVPELMIESFSPIDLLFYGIALYEGYKFSFKKVVVVR